MKMIQMATARMVKPLTLHSRVMARRKRGDEEKTEDSTIFRQEEGTIARMTRSRAKLKSEGLEPPAAASETWDDLCNSR